MVWNHRACLSSLSGLDVIYDRVTVPDMFDDADIRSSGVQSLGRFFLKAGWIKN